MRKIWPAPGARPSTRNVARELGCSPSSFSDRVHRPAVISIRGKPFSAWKIAGASDIEKGSAPKRLRKASHPATTPGTVTVKGPRWGILSAAPLLLTKSGVIAFGDQPLAFRP